MKSKASFHYSRNLLWWNDTLWFHFTIVDITYRNLTSFFLYYKDIIRKAFITIATLLILLLENEVLHVLESSFFPPYVVKNHKVLQVKWVMIHLWMSVYWKYSLSYLKKKEKKIQNMVEFLINTFSSELQYSAPIFLCIL